MKDYLHIIALTLIIVSCRNKADPRKHKEAVSDTAAKSHSNYLVEKNDNLTFVNFEEFWILFRKAVVNSDTTQIAALTEFPFETRGPLDHDPTIKHSQQKFREVFQAFLNQYSGVDLEGTTELDGIEKTTTLSKPDIADDQIRIGNMVFKNTKNGWKLAFAYLNNETIDSLSAIQ